MHFGIIKDCEKIMIISHIVITCIKVIINPIITLNMYISVTYYNVITNVFNNYFLSVIYDSYIVIYFSEEFKQ
jgi:hypothetical protein